MKTILIFDIPRSKTGKKLRMRLLRLFAKENVNKLQDSVWDISQKEHLIGRIIDHLNELKSQIENETKNKPKVIILKSKIVEII